MKLTEEAMKTYVSGLFARAREAQKTIEFATQEQVDYLCKVICRAVTNPKTAEEIGRLAYEESGMGTLEAKAFKLRKRANGVLWDIRNMKSVGVIDEIPEKALVKIAKPVGVVGALIPSTQPEVTPVANAVNAIKCRDAIVFSPHPKTQRTTLAVCERMRAALKKRGWSEDLIICAENPSIPMSKEIMAQADLVVATGGGAMVKAAYSSGTPAFGVGVGNAHCVVDETADLADAAKKIVFSKILDNAAGCSCENALVIQDSVYDAMLGKLREEGCHVASPAEKEKIQRTLWPEWPESHMLNRDFITQSVDVIGKLSGIGFPAGTRAILVEETLTGPGTPFAGEKLSLVLTVYKYRTLRDAIDIINANLAYQGAGHTCGIHSKNNDAVLELALNTYTTRVVVNQAFSAANSGNWNSGVPWTTTLGCGTWGGNAASENIVAKHYMNTTWVSRPLSEVIVEPTDEEIFGDVIHEEF